MLAPLYGIIVADYYLVRRQHLDLQQLFSAERSGIYHFNAGWNRKAMIAFGGSALFSVASVWVPGLENLSGFAWLLAGGICYTVGIVFFVFDDRLRHWHGIWHIFVMVGSLLHFIAILFYVI